MIDIKEWKWEPISKKESLTKTKTITCPYCNFHVRTIPNTRIVDVSSGAIKHTIHRCPECFMPVIIGLDGKIIPQSQWLPFEDVKFLPPPIESLYNECRKCYQNECYHSVVMVARSLLMHICVDKGDTPGKSFVDYINFLETNGYIGSQNKPWVDKIRTIANDYVHKIVVAKQDDAEKVIIFIKQLLGNLYEMPQLAV